MQLTQEQIEEIQAAFGKGESITLEPTKPKVYEPGGGNFWVNDMGAVCYSGGSGRLAGRERKTKEQAVQLAGIVNPTHRLHAWACDNGFNRDFVEGDYNWSVRVTTGKTWAVSNFTNYRHGTVYMTEEGAETAAKAINEGVLVL